MYRLICIILGFFFLVIGIIGVLTPIPFGIVFLLLSMLLLIPTMPSAAPFIRKLRMRYNRFDQVMTTIAHHAPTPYRRILRETEIDELERSGYKRY